MAAKLAVRLAACAALVAALVGTSVLAQERESGGRGHGREGRGPGGGGPPGRGSRREVTPAELKEKLGFSEEDWAAVEPLLKAVVAKRQELKLYSEGTRGGGPPGGDDPGRRGREGGGGEGGRRGGPEKEKVAKDTDGAKTADQERGGPDRGEGEHGSRGHEQQRETPKELEELQKLLDDAETKSAKVAEGLYALREARQGKQKELEEACAKLTKYLTSRQEAQLVMMGVLE